MKTVLLVLMILCMVAVVATLFAGLLTLARPNHDAARSNRLMRYRVVFQGAALAVFFVLMALYRSS